ncbi:MAG: transcriptional regulator [Anaerolineales bacterium]|nr:MAG: transcriptional regulator [Anaerolineales bacterium]
MSGSETHGDRLASLVDIDRLIHEPARLTILAFLTVVDSADFVFLMRQTGLTWGNLSSHMSKLEEAGYIQVEKEFRGRKPYTMLHLTQEGRVAFQEYRHRLRQVLDDLPD